jgi:cobalt-zinc-cadmium efflux system outer membrane protein
LRQRTAEAIAAASRAEAELAFARAEVAGEVDRARAALEAADRQSDAARRRRELTADNLQLIEKAFALGEADLTTLLRVRAAALDAQAFDLRQRAARDEAVSQLRQALGALP